MNTQQNQNLRQQSIVKQPCGKTGIRLNSQLFKNPVPTPPTLPQRAMFGLPPPQVNALIVVKSRTGTIANIKFMAMDLLYWLW